MIATRVADTAFDPGSELAQLAGSAPGAGGVVSFTGLVRAEQGAVSRLALEAHPVLTARSLETIAVDACARFDLIAVRIVHRAGELAPDEPIVFAGAAAAHRRAAFLAVDYMMDRLKTEAVFWKREDGTGASRWIEPCASDTADHARWAAGQETAA